jgi:phage terminase large subunit GpA-like protein
MNRNGQGKTQREVASWYWSSLRIPTRLTVTEWADRYRVLSRESSAEPGRWSTARTPYLRGIMDALTDPHYEMVIWVASTQVGKTECGLNFVGWIMDQDPGPTLVVQPTLELGRAWSKDRLAPMLRDTPQLAEKISGKRGLQDLDELASNEQLHKSFPGGHITIVGSNSTSGLAARPIRYVIGDELDRWEAAAGDEGDQIELVRRRTETFWNRKILFVSSPGVKGLSRIERYYELSDRRRYEVPCPRCVASQVLAWDNLRWEKTKTGAHRPETAHFVCVSCQQRIDERWKAQLLEVGRWRATAPAGKIAGFHLWAAYSPWKSWASIVEDFLRTHAHREPFKVFVNTVLAQTWEEPGEAPEWELLMQRAEPRQQWIVPDGVYFLTCGVDVQEDRLEASVYGWGADEECWLVGHGILYGSTDKDEVYRALDQLLATPWPQPTQQRTLVILATAIDSGYKTQEVYRYCRGRTNVFATKGVAERTAPPVGRPSFQDISHLGQQVKRGVRLWPLGTHVLKSTLYSRLRLTEPGPRFLHFPHGLDEEFYQQLTAEKLVTRYVKGFPVQEWQKTRARNEALDCLVEAYAAALIAGIERVNWDAAARAMTPSAPPAPQHPPAPGPPDPRAVVQFGPPTLGRTRQMRSSGHGVMSELLRR